MIQIQEFIEKWLPSISTTSVFAAIVWFGRKSISEWLTHSIRHEYDHKIETLKSSLRQRETQIEALRGGALSSVLNRQNLLYEKQLNAAEVIWRIVISLSPAKSISFTMALVDFKKIIDVASINPKVKEMFQQIGNDFNWTTINTKEAVFVRPFLSPTVWALYFAYESILMNAVSKYEILKLADPILKPQIKDIADYFTSAPVINLIKEALPYRKEYIEKNKDSAFHSLLEELESKILEEIKLMLKGDQVDKEGLEQAAQIIKAAEAVNESISKIQSN